MMLIKQIWQPTWAAEEDVSVSGRSNLPYLLISAVTSKGQKRLLTPGPEAFTTAKICHRNMSQEG